MRRNREKELQNSRNFGAPRAQNLRALGQCRLRKPQNVVASLHRVERALICKSAQVTRRDHANLRAKLARNNCKIPEILARRAQRNCLNSASMRCVSRRTSLQLLTESEMRPNAKKVRAWRRCQANFAPNSREEFSIRKFKIPEMIPARRAHKGCVHSASERYAC